MLLMSRIVVGVYYQYTTPEKVDESQSYTSISDVPVPDWYDEVYTQKMKDKENYINQGYTPDVVRKNVKKILRTG